MTTLREITKEALKEILKKHLKWLNDEPDGENANLSSADLSSADLRYADLSSANLIYADLSYANLSSANLSSADLDKTIVQIAGIGSARRMTTYCADYDKVWCGCFTGTLKEFTERCLETHKENPKYLSEYKAAITFFKTIEKMYKKIQKSKPQETAK